METQAQFRNGYIQPDFNPNNRDRALTITLAITFALFVIYQTCLS